MKMLVIWGIIIGLLIYFSYLLSKYSGRENPEYRLEYFRDEENIEYSPIIVGFLGKRKVGEKDFIATVLDFVIKGDISMKKTIDNDYIFTIIREIKGEPIEIRALEIFFNEYLNIGVKQSLSQFEIIIKNEKIFGNYGKIQRSFNKEIREYFDKKQEVKQITRKTNIKNMILCYILFLIAFFTLRAISEFSYSSDPVVIFMAGTTIYLFFILAITFIKQFLLGNCSWILPILTTFLALQAVTIGTSLVNTNYNFVLILLLMITMGIVIIFDDMLQRKNTKLANACEMIKGLKKYIQDYSNIDQYDLYNVNLWNRYYIYAIVLGINKI